MVISARRQSMSTLSSSLSLAGRSSSGRTRESDAKEREAIYAELVEGVLTTLKKRSEHAKFAKMDVRDIVCTNDAITFVGCGTHSNEAGFNLMMSERVWKTRVIAHVRDIFDFHESRPFLSSYMKFASVDVTVMLTSVMMSSHRRLVNEYVLNEAGEYELNMHDVEFIKYVHSKGYRVMPAKDAADLERKSVEPIPPQQSTNHVLMVAPTAFVKNAQAAEDNHFMNDHYDPQGTLMDAEEFASQVPMTDEQKGLLRLQRQVLREFSELHRILTDEVGLQIHLFTHEHYHDTPDAVFPNNWFSTHTDLECGECTLILYPMKVPNRRKERRPEFLTRLESFQRYTHVFDLTRQERASRPAFLEGTGSLVLDRIHRVAYVALSERSELALATKWAKLVGYELVTFAATDEKGRAIYHTNVMMAIGTSVAVVCLECIPDPDERARVKNKLESTGHEIVDITREQVNHFCGNVLEVEHWRGYPVLTMSTQAYNAFTPEQRATLLRHETDLIHADISTIERIGGGGVRCAIAELF